MFNEELVKAGIMLEGRVSIPAPRVPGFNSPGTSAP
jgi:hypothetical protein